MVDPIGDPVAGPTRRAAVAGLGAMTAVMAVPARAQQDAAGRTPPVVMVTGIVFEDRSGLGRRQDSDPGLPGVAVSNGRDVVRTDIAGRYSLQLTDGDAVFVVKPSGYSVRAPNSG